MPSVEQFKEIIDTLKRMIDDPHPGLSTWSELFGKKVEELYRLWEGSDDRK